MGRDEDFEAAIRTKNISAIVELVFSIEKNIPRIRPSFCTETALWDYKRDCPHPGKANLNAWAHLASDVVAFHNEKGGVIFFGIDDDFSFVGTRVRLDSKMVADQLRRYVGDTLWVDFHRYCIQGDQRYLGVAVVPPRGPRLVRFSSDAPEVSGKRLFRRNDSALRVGDSSVHMTAEKAAQLCRTLSQPAVGRIYEVDEPYYRILNPDYHTFVHRESLCKTIEVALSDERCAVAGITGIGGVGKTALATWAVLQEYDRRSFEFIVSTTAKDRELTSSGIRALRPGLTSFDNLLNSILEVLQIDSTSYRDPQDKEAEVRGLIKKSNGLLFVDNLETVDDPRIITFLDTLPVGVKAITTSRKQSVRVSVHPVDVGTLSQEESSEFIDSLASLPGMGYLRDLSASEKSNIGSSCDGIPLAIRWCLATAGAPSEALRTAERIGSSSSHGEELLEFCFRRVFDSLPGDEKAILYVLSLFQRPLLSEALSVGASLPYTKSQDAIEGLREDALLMRYFDDSQNDYVFQLSPLVRTFVYTQLQNMKDKENNIRRRLSDWYEAHDVADPRERVVVREIRQGKSTDEDAMIGLARSAERRGDIDSAMSLLERSLERDPSSWRSARLLAEIYRHRTGQLTKALELYERAGACAPRHGPERSLIYREWGMLLRKSGDPGATEQAIEKFEEALKESPNDAVAAHALAHMYQRRGELRRVVDLLEPLVKHRDRTTRSKSAPILLKAYEGLNELLKAAELRERLRSGDFE